MPTIDTHGFLARHEVFTVREFREALGTEAPAHSVWLRLDHALERGWVERVTRGLYVSRAGLFGERQPDPLVVASKLADDAMLVYHSALEGNGVAHSQWFRVTVSSQATPRWFVFRGVEYKRLRERSQLIDRQVRTRFTTLARRGEYLLPVSTRERTVVDCLGQPDLAGGFEELLRSIGGFPSLHVDELLDYLDVLGSPTLVARVAWALFAAPDHWRLTRMDALQFKNRLGRGPYYLSRLERDVRFVPEWRLYVPADLDAEELLVG